MFIAILIPLSLFFVATIVKQGWAEAFRHLTPLDLVIGILALAAFSTVFTLFIALLMRLTSVRLTGDLLIGRNYWGLKKKIPLTDITALSQFSSSGLNAIIVSSSRHGKIYISTHTENLAGLVTLLETYLPRQANT